MEQELMEEWKPIPGYEGLYEASSMGRIKSLSRLVDYGTHQNMIPERILATTLRLGYPRLKLSKDGKYRTIYVHRLVALAFFGEYPEYLQVNHKNGIRTDNRVTNLELVTQLSNILHSLKPGPRGAYLNRGRWAARMSVLGQEIFIGSFDTKEEAQEAYKKEFIRVRGFLPW